MDITVPVEDSPIEYVPKVIPVKDMMSIQGLCISRIYLKNIALFWDGTMEQFTMQVEAGQNSYVSPGVCWSSSHWRSAYVDV